MSASMPRGVEGDWEEGFQFAEEDCVPDALKDLLTDKEKARRSSIRADDVDITPFSQSHKIGASPIPGSPSARWGGSAASWSRHDSTEDRNGRPKYGASPFGHVGSPLRHSSLIESDLNSTAVGTSSRQPPSRRATGSNESLSLLSQQMQRTRLESDSISGGSSPRLRGLNGMPSGRDKSAMERHFSNSSIGSGRPGPRPIDEEEEGDFVFDMDDDDSLLSKTKIRRSGGTAGFVWSYANTTSSTPTSKMNGSSTSNGHLSSREHGVIGR